MNTKNKNELPEYVGLVWIIHFGFCVSYFQSSKDIISTKWFMLILFGTTVVSITILRRSQLFVPLKGSDKEIETKNGNNSKSTGSTCKK